MARVLFGLWVVATAAWISLVAWVHHTSASAHGFPPEYDFPMLPVAAIPPMATGLLVALAFWLDCAFRPAR